MKLRRVRKLIRKYIEFLIVFLKHYAARKKIPRSPVVTVATNINSGSMYFEHFILHSFAVIYKNKLWRNEIATK